MKNEKREAIVRLVEKHKGVWPSQDRLSVIMLEDELGFVSWLQFTNKAKELGYINGYRYGVEYPTNGEKPDLPDDVMVRVFNDDIGWRSLWVGKTVWVSSESFRIVDERYKPKSNIEAPLCGKTAAQLERDNWHVLGKLPPVGSVCAFHKNEDFLYAPEIEERWLDGDELEVLGHRIGEGGTPVAVVWNVRDKYPSCLIKEALKPWQSERDKAVDKAHEIIGKSNREWCEMLYDAGMLKLPENNQKETSYD